MLAVALLVQAAYTPTECGPPDSLIRQEARTKGVSCTEIIVEREQSERAANAKEQRPAPIDCPPEGSLLRKNLKFSGEICQDEIDAQIEEARAEKAFVQRGIQFSNRPLPPAMQAAVRRRMDELLRDEPSTRYRWESWKHPEIYCFQFNAKNGFGAYGGWQSAAFWITRGGKVGDPADLTLCDFAQ